MKVLSNTFLHSVTSG